MSTVIFYNPKCSKCRTTLSILEEKGVDFEVIKYLENTPSVDELKDLLNQLNMDARSLMRTFEAPYKENNLDDESLSEDDLIQAMIDNPILIERPIVKTDKGIVIARPPENVLGII
ncbi:MAG: arsenate reductase (glutaredoxin) [Candidatus Thioglobus sp.]|jgi:arsenate reductase|uniref:arsenate reductase (glutaredoxin) n=1 Tax=Candidatus Thioglobus sp. TaxID=2026721 RepID=UPI0001BD3527|nr:arsenate reductase (glutaredoxin) [Candidatus Thioglobus sp.]EEZ80787.1 MAG: arsenate reductase [uncultured Candidatus Thioglobus sp.]MBT3186256.1 arsenate reductase (glutaredoxin) [Candidatus Thioglobus sp.]MBT3431342.1 arsenate reductase (glutaredoxin) [Candidatus Thioglobus sp.]MBT4316580.1 arsenate reductase (glutaredoxin) [Candidatus Thioglobus sp.]MBT4553989.1 arsenate reductase (glutaredoxin) [Candidatus Thioglobus sp.]